MVYLKKNSETKQNLISRMYDLDPNKVLWDKYKKLQRKPRVENNLIK